MNSGIVLECSAGAAQADKKTVDDSWRKFSTEVIMRDCYLLLIYFHEKAKVDVFLIDYISSYNSVATLFSKKLENWTAWVDQLRNFPFLGK